MGEQWLLGLVMLFQATSSGGVQLASRQVVTSESPQAPLPWEQIHPHYRELIRDVMANSSLSATGPKETFPCTPEHYYWFLDNPDRTVVAWRRLGAKCVSIARKSENSFFWTDGQGSEIVWETALRDGRQRVWYAHGKVKPGPLLPAVPVKAVVVLHHELGKEGDTTLVQHHSDLYMQTDSRSAKAVTRMFGRSAGKMAENGLGQLQLFFSGVCWYLNRYPDRADELMR